MDLRVLVRECGNPGASTDGTRLPAGNLIKNTLRKAVLKALKVAEADISHKKNLDKIFN